MIYDLQNGQNNYTRSLQFNLFCTSLRSEILGWQNSVRTSIDLNSIQTYTYLHTVTWSWNFYIIQYVRCRNRANRCEIHVAIAFCWLIPNTRVCFHAQCASPIDSNRLLRLRRLCVRWVKRRLNGDLGMVVAMITPPTGTVPLISHMILDLAYPMAFVGGLHIAFSGTGVTRNSV